MTNARRLLWLEDLESIRRERPLYDGEIEDVTIRRTLPRTQASPVDVISVDSDSDDNGGGLVNGSTDDQIWGYNRAEVQTYYGLQGLTRRQAASLLQYQTGYAPQAEYPSTAAGLRFDMAQLRRDLGWPARVPQGTIDTAFEVQNFQDSVPVPLEAALSTYWLADMPDLLRGFPLVKDVVFVVQQNMAGEASDCFFKAVAFLIYGNYTYHPRVKAEHLQHFHEVLQWTAHPRHQLYLRMNRRFYTTVVGGGTRALPVVRTVANFYQMLTVPKIYTALDMFDVTADLYNLFIVVYTLDEHRVVTGVTTMGSYNARHVFLCHVNGNHFQPMVPNDYYASEFRLPRITYQSTLGQPMTSNRDQKRHALDHAWRNRWSGYLDRRQGPLPVEHVFYSTTLANVMRGTQIN